MWVWAVVVMGLGCSSVGGRHRPALYSGNVEDPPTMSVLPAPDVSLAAMTDTLRFAWELAQESFDVRPPSAPVDPDVAYLQTWVNETLEGWLEQKTERIAVARKEFDDAAEQNHRQRIIAGAVVGMLYEDVARVLLSVPVPMDLRSEPDIVDVYRSIVFFQAKPYLAHSERAYRACAANASEPKGMRHWSRFCAERASRLPEAVPVPGGAAQTRVVVYRE